MPEALLRLGEYVFLEQKSWRGTRPGYLFAKSAEKVRSVSHCPATPSQASRDSPQWHRLAMACEPPPQWVFVEGAKIEFRTWGAEESPGLLLLHGGRAHGQWWSHLAPALAKHWRVAALSFSGMGQSDWRDAYSTGQYAREAARVAEAACLFGQGAPTLVAHSFGAAAAAHALAEGWPGVGVIIDSAANWHSGAPLRSTSRASHRVFSSEAEALDAFVLAPAQSCENGFLLDAVARRGLRQVEGGYTWSFDPRLLTRIELGETRELLRSSRGPLAFINGENSEIMSREVVAELKEQFPAAAMVEIPESGHHVLFDQPMALVVAIRCLLLAHGGTGSFSNRSSG